MGDGGDGETERKKDVVDGEMGRGLWESNDVGRQVEGRKSVGGGCSGREGSMVARSGTLCIPLAYLEPN